MKMSVKNAVVTFFTLLASAVAWADLVYTNPLAGYDYSLEVNDVVYAAMQTRASITLAEADGNNFDRIVYQDSDGANDVRTHTISMWVKVNSLVDNQLLWWVCSGWNGSHSGYAVKAMADGRIRVGKASYDASWNGGNYRGDYYTRNFGFTAGTWTHITLVVVKRETERVADVTVYKDGVAITDEVIPLPTNLNGTGGSETFVRVGANICVAGVRVYDEALTAEQVTAIDRTASLLAAPEATIATVDAEAVNASELVWSNGEPSEENRAVITAEVPATLTMDSAIVAHEIATAGEKITFLGSEVLTSELTKITADTDVSGITAGLGDILIAAGKILTIGPNYSGTFINGENRGTINVRGGTMEAPVVVNNGTTANENIGAITVEADSVLRLHATGGNKVYKVTGSGASSRVLVTSIQDWGVTASGSKISNCTLEVPQYITGTTANATFWLTPSTLGENVHLVIDENRRLIFETSGSPLFASLSGKGNIAASGSCTITIANESEAEYAGVIAGGHAIVKRGSGTQIFSGANTYSGATQVLEGVLKIAADGSLGTGGVSIAEGATLEWASTADKTFPSSISGAGTLKTVTDQVYYVSGTLPKSVELAQGTLNFGTARFLQTELKLSEDDAANATLAITLTAEDVAAGSVEICQVPYADGADTLPDGLTVAITPEEGVEDALTDWSLRVVGGRLIYALPAVTHQWVAGATDWAAGVPDFKQGDSIFFGETEANTSITFPYGLVAGDLTISGNYTFREFDAPMAVTSVTVEEGAKLNLHSIYEAKYLRLTMSNVSGGTNNNSFPAFSELILTKDDAPVAWPLGTTIYQLNADGTQTEPDWAATGNESVNALIDTVYLDSGNGRTYTNPETGVRGEYTNTVDAIIQNKWWPLNQANAYAVITLGEEISFDGYRLMSTDYQPRSPKDWTLEVSNDGVTWSIVDQQVNHAIPTTNAFYVYDSETGSTIFPTEDIITVDASITVRGELTGNATIAGDVVIAEGGAIVVDGETYLTIEGELSGSVKFVIPAGADMVPLVKIDAENVKTPPVIVDTDGNVLTYEFDLIDGVYYAHDTTAPTVVLSEDMKVSEFVWTNGVGGEVLTLPLAKPYPYTLYATAPVMVMVDTDMTVKTLVIDAGEEITLDGTGAVTAETTIVKADLDVSNVAAALGAVSVAEGRILTVTYNKESQPYTSLNAPEGALRVANDVSLEFTTDLLTGAGTWIVGEGSTTTLPGGRTNDANVVVKVEGTLDVNGTYDAIFKGVTLADGGVWTNTGTPHADIDGKKQYANVTLEGGTATISGNSFGSIALGYAAQTMYLNGGTLDIAMASDNTFYIASANILKSAAEPNAEAGTIQVSSGSVEFMGDENAEPFAVTTTLRMVDGRAIFADRDYTIGTLVGTGGVVEVVNKTLTVGALNTDSTYAGTIVGSGAIAKEGSGTLTLSGNNTDADVTLLVHGGQVVLANNYVGPITVDAGAELVVESNATFLNAINGTGHIRVKGATCEMSRGGTFTGTLEIESGSTVTLSEAQLASLSRIVTAEGATLKIATPINTALLGGEVRIPLADATSTIAGDLFVVLPTGEEFAASYTDGVVTGTVTANPTVTGSVWWWDYEFNGSSASIGSDTSSFTLEGSATTYTEAVDGNQELYLQKTPWRAASFSNQKTFTAVMSCQVGSYNNSAFVSFGSTQKNAGLVAIVLATGANAENGEMRLLLVRGENHAVTPLAENLIVPNATTMKHLYAFTFVVSEDTTTVSVYVDGELKKIAVINEALYLGNGFQFGSIFGDVQTEETGLNRYPASGNSGTVDFLRVSKEVLSSAAIQALAEVYSSASQLGTAVRTIDTSAAQWVAEDAWTQNVPDQEAVSQAAPNRGTHVAVTAATDTQLTLNLEEDTPYETVTFAGEGTITVGYGESGKKVLSGSTAVKTDVVLSVDTIQVGALEIAAGKKLIFDFSEYDFRVIYKTMRLPLTGFVTKGEGASVELRMPETLPAHVTSWDFEYDELTQEYAVNFTVADGDYIGTVSEDCTWSEITWKKGEFDVKLPAGAKLENVPVTLIAETDATVTLEDNMTFSAVTIQQAGITLTGAYTVKVPATALTTAAPLVIDSEITLDLTGATVGSYERDIQGAGTVKLKLDGGTQNAITLNGFNGTTYVVSGRVCIDCGQLGSTLKVGKGVHLYTTKETTDATLNIIAEEPVSIWSSWDTYLHVDFPYVTTGVLQIYATSGLGLYKTGNGTFTAAAIRVNYLDIRGGAVIVDPGESGEESRINQHTGNAPLYILSGTTSLNWWNNTWYGNVSPYSGQIEIAPGATLNSLRFESTPVPLTTGKVINNGTLSINSNNAHLPEISGTGDIIVLRNASIAGDITTTGTLTISAPTKMTHTNANFTDADLTINGPSLVLNSTLETTDEGSSVAIASGKSISGSGSLVGDLTLASGSMIDASAGTVRVTGNVITEGLVRVTNLPAHGTPVLTYAGPLPVNPATTFVAEDSIAFASTNEGITSIFFRAATSHAYFTYAVEDGEVTLTGCQADCPAEVVIPSSINGRPVTAIAANAFADCTGLTSIELSPGITSIGANAFSGCTGLTSLQIPASVTSIGSGAFDFCSNLKIEVAESNEVYASQDGALFNKEMTRLIRAPGAITAYAIPESVQAIESYAFCGCPNLIMVVIPAGTTEIGEGAFADCSALTMLALPEGMTEISRGLFAGCSRLATLTIPSTVTAIGEYAFAECTALTAITIPAGVTEIGASAFEGCTSLATVAFLGTPPETVGEGAFPATQGTYLYEYVTEWKTVIADGKWNNLTIKCSNPPSFSVTLTAVGGGEVSGGGVYKFEEEVTVTATVPTGYIFCGWSTDPSVLTTSYTFVMPDEPVALTAYFALKSVIDHHVTANKLMTREEAKQALLDADEVFTSDEMKEMAFGAPVVEVGADSIKIAISLQTAETLDAWQAMALDDATLDVDREKGQVTVTVPKDGKKAAFYKFIVPAEQSR